MNENNNGHNVNLLSKMPIRKNLFRFKYYISITKISDDDDDPRLNVLYVQMQLLLEITK